MGYQYYIWTTRYTSCSNSYGLPILYGLLHEVLSVFTAIGPNIKVKTLIYVDDIQNASSSIEGLEKAVRNCRILEETKGYTFNIDPKKTATLIVDKKKNKTYDHIKLEIKKGKIEQTKEYKYLGEWYNEKGNHSTSIKKREDKTGYFICLESTQWKRE